MFSFYLLYYLLTGTWAFSSYRYLGNILATTGHLTPTVGHLYASIQSVSQLCAYITKGSLISRVMVCHGTRSCLQLRTVWPPPHNFTKCINTHPVTTLSIALYVQLWNTHGNQNMCLFPTHHIAAHKPTNPIGC